MLEERIDRPTAAVSRPTAVAVEGCEPPWVALLDGLLALAGQTPYEIDSQRGSR